VRWIEDLKLKTVVVVIKELEERSIRLGQTSGEKVSRGRLPREVLFNAY
jgi:hypothetical protein